MSEEQFEAAMQILQHGVCRWNVEDFWKLLHEEKDYHGTDSDHRFVNKQFKEWTANPFKFLMGLDPAYRHHLFEKAKESLVAALA